MALFTRTKKSAEGGSSSGGKNTDKAVTAPAAVGTTKPVRESLSGGVADVLKNPRITEKATMHSDVGVYTFDVTESATKRDILKAVRVLYSVSPRKVAIVTIPKKWKRNMRTGKKGMQGGGKKAYVYLKKGETITIV